MVTEAAVLLGTTDASLRDLEGVVLSMSGESWSSSPVCLMYMSFCDN